MERPAPPHYERYDDSDNEEISLPAENSPTVWSIIKQVERENLALQGANDALIAKLLAVGLDDSLVFNDNDQQEEDGTEEIESNPIIVILSSNNRTLLRLQKRNDELTALLKSREAEERKSPETISSLFGFFESDFEDYSDTDTEEDKTDPINNPQPSTSSGITHPKPYRHFRPFANRDSSSDSESPDGNPDEKECSDSEPDISDPINNPQPSTSSDFTHSKPMAEEKRKVPVPQSSNSTGTTSEKKTSKENIESYDSDSSSPEFSDSDSSSSESSGSDSFSSESSDSDSDSNSTEITSEKKTSKACSNASKNASTSSGCPISQDTLEEENTEFVSETMKRKLCHADHAAMEEEQSVQKKSRYLDDPNSNSEPQKVVNPSGSCQETSLLTNETESVEHPSGSSNQSHKFEDLSEKPLAENSDGNQNITRRMDFQSPNTSSTSYPLTNTSTNMNNNNISSISNKNNNENVKNKEKEAISDDTDSSFD